MRYSTAPGRSSFCSCFIGFLTGVGVALFAVYAYYLYRRHHGELDQQNIWVSDNPASCQEQLHHALKNLVEMAPRLRDAEEKARMASMLVNGICVCIVTHY